MSDYNDGTAVIVRQRAKNFYYVRGVGGVKVARGLVGEDALTCAYYRIRINESTNFRIIISAIEVIESKFCVEVVAVVYLSKEIHTLTLVIVLSLIEEYKANVLSSSL